MTFKNALMKEMIARLGYLDDDFRLFEIAEAVSRDMGNVSEPEATAGRIVDKVLSGIVSNIVAGGPEDIAAYLGELGKDHSKKRIRDVAASFM